MNDLFDKLTKGLFFLPWKPGCIEMSDRPVEEKNCIGRNQKIILKSIKEKELCKFGHSNLEQIMMVEKNAFMNVKCILMKMTSWFIDLETISYLQSKYCLKINESLHLRKLKNFNWNFHTSNFLLNQFHNTLNENHTEFVEFSIRAIAQNFIETDQNIPVFWTDKIPFLMCFALCSQLPVHITEPYKIQPFQS